MKRTLGNKKTEGDFKRLKAKVGKRAPKKLNETETKFKTATVQVQSQSIVNETVERNASLGGLAFSSSGKQFSHLTAQLNHHSAKARTSAAQGIRDVIKNTPESVIPNYLSIIIPSVSKCLIDEESDVRSIAISTLFEEISPRLASCNLSDRMKPFLPISLAYIGSALHSLDQDVRYDGCKALHHLCTEYSNLFLAGENEIVHLQSLLPAFVMLFDDVIGGLSSMSRRGVGSLSSSGVDKNKSKDKQTKKNRDSRALGVLKSFVSVTNHTTTFRMGYDVLVGNSVNLNETSHHHFVSRADLTFCSGGRTSNALVWKNDQVHHTCKISDMKKLEYSYRESSNDGKFSSRLDFNTLLSLFLRLRDRFVEVTQRGKHGEKGLYLSAGDASELSLVVSSLRVLWIGYCEEILTIKRLENDSNFKKMKASAITALNLLLESFTVQDTSGNASNRDNYDSLNASMCMLLSEIGGALNDASDSDTLEWMDAIFIYVVPAMESIDNMDNENSRLTLMTVIERLLLPSEMASINCPSDIKHSCQLNNQKYMELLEKFKRAYFNRNESRDKIRGSAEGRKVVSLLLSLIHKHLTYHKQFELNDILMTLIEMSSQLPMYLKIWRGSYPRDTATVLETLSVLSRSLVRQDNKSDDRMDMANSFLKNLQSSLEKLFTASKKQRKIRVTGLEVKAKVSVFEELSCVGQTLLLNLIGFLEEPTSKLIEDLAQICARRITINSSDGKSLHVQLLSDSVIDYLMSVVHFMRRQMSLKQYLTFLINSSGFHACHFEENTEGRGEAHVNSNSYDGYSNMFTYDSAVARMCKYLLMAESKQVMPMLKPILDSWLSISDEDHIIFQAVKLRAAITLLSCHALSVRNGHRPSVEIMLDDIAFRTRLNHAIMKFLLDLPIENSDDLNVVKIYSKLMSPFMVSHPIA
jgi:pre-rRNA-processing protein IPI1